MKIEEEVSEKYLKSLGFENIKYEPLGTTTFPDFLIDENIGVEVRRLNRNHIDDTKIEADNLTSKYKKEISKILDSIKPDGTTFYIDFYIESNNGIIDENRLFDGLKEYLQACDTTIGEHKINDYLNISLIQGSPDTKRKFKFNATHVPFFWIEEQYIKDIQYCIDDKQSKKEKQQEKLSNFKEFWLVLIDFLFQDDSSEYDFSSLNLKDFSRVVIIDTKANEQKVLTNVWEKQ